MRKVPRVAGQYPGSWGKGGLWWADMSERCPANHHLTAFEGKKACERHWKMLDFATSKPMDLYDLSHLSIHPPMSSIIPRSIIPSFMACPEALVFSSSLSAIDVLLQQIQRRTDRPGALKVIGDVAPEQRQAPRRGVQKNDRTVVYIWYTMVYHGIPWYTIMVHHYDLNFMFLST